MLENVTNAFKQQLDNVKDKTSDVADALSGKVTALKEAGADKIKSYMDENISWLAPGRSGWF